MASEPLTIQLIEPAQTVGLRSRIMRPGRPREDSIYPGDADSTTFHIGAFDGGALVGIVSFYLEPYPERPQAAAVRFRGMAVEPDLQSKGVGSQLLSWALEEVRRRGGTNIVWCNARTPAVEFYRRLGFTTVGDEFSSEIGPHFRMVREL